MKNIIFTLFFCFSSIFTYSQAGVYITENDFKNNKLVELGECIYNSSWLVEFKKDSLSEVVVYKWNEIFAIKDNDGRLLRGEYALVLEANICIWVKTNGEFKFNYDNKRGFIDFDYLPKKRESFYDKNYLFFSISSKPTSKMSFLSTKSNSLLLSLLKEEDRDLYNIYNDIPKKNFSNQVNLGISILFIERNSDNIKTY